MIKKYQNIIFTLKKLPALNQYCFFGSRFSYQRYFFVSKQFADSYYITNDIKKIVFFMEEISVPNGIK